MSATTSPAATTGTGRIRLLKKQLEEARIQEQEKMDRMKDLERLVKDLQSQVTNRDDLIARMREDQFSVASFQSESPFVMSPVQNRSPNRSPQHGQSFDDSFIGSSSFNDDRLLTLQEKNIELERKLMDMEESLKAKDELVKVRTEAVTLMSADLALKGKNTLDQLEDTREEMRTMQKNFAEKESLFKSSSNFNHSSKKKH